MASCVHGCMLPSSSLSNRMIMVRTIYQKFNRIMFHDQNGRVISTIYRPTTPRTVSNPFNPYCQQCVISFLNYVRQLGYSPRYSIHMIRSISQLTFHRLFYNNHNLDLDLDHHHNLTALETVYWPMWSITERHCYPLTIAREEFLAAWLLADQDSGGVMFTPASMSAIEELEKVDVKEGSSSDIDLEDCSICLERLVGDEEEKEEIKKLGCGHMFHGGCIVEWLKCSHYCPLCRFKLPSEVD